MPRGSARQQSAETRGRVFEGRRAESEQNATRAAGGAPARSEACAGARRYSSMFMRGAAGEGAVRGVSILPCLT